MLALPGLERMRLSVDRSAVPPPIHHLTGLRPTEADAGSCTFTMPVTPWLQTPVPDLIPGGVIAFVADAPLGSAIMTALPPLAYMTTTDLSLSFLRPTTLDSAVLTGRGRVLHAGRSVALSEVAIEDAHGRLVAHGTSRGFVMTVPAVPPPPEPPAPVEWSTPDPYLRSLTGAPISIQDWSRAGGLEILRRCVEDLASAPPIYHLTGLRPIEAIEGRVSFVLPASRWLMPPVLNLYGGAIALLADAALSGAVMTVIPPGGSFVSLDLKVNFLRPVLPDGNLLTAVAVLRHRGRTMAVATAELFNEDGKRIAIASSSALLLLDRGWSEITSASDREVAAPA